MSITGVGYVQQEDVITKIGIDAQSNDYSLKEYKTNISINDDKSIIKNVVEEINNKLLRGETVDLAKYPKLCVVHYRGDFSNNNNNNNNNNQKQTSLDSDAVNQLMESSHSEVTIGDVRNQIHDELILLRNTRCDDECWFSCNARQHDNQLYRHCQRYINDKKQFKKESKAKKHPCYSTLTFSDIPYISTSDTVKAAISIALRTISGMWYKDSKVSVTMQTIIQSLDDIVTQSPLFTSSLHASDRIDIKNTLSRDRETIFLGSIPKEKIVDTVSFPYVDRSCLPREVCDRFQSEPINRKNLMNIAECHSERIENNTRSIVKSLGGCLVYILLDGTLSLKPLSVSDMDRCRNTRKDFDINSTLKLFIDSRKKSSVAVSRKAFSRGIGRRGRGHPLYQNNSSVPMITSGRGSTPIGRGAFFMRKSSHPPNITTGRQLLLPRPEILKLRLDALQQKDIIDNNKNDSNDIPDDSTMPELETEVQSESNTSHPRYAQRIKQIKIGKCTVGYTNYLSSVPLCQRIPNIHLETPRVNSETIISSTKRVFEAEMKIWRRYLHTYDDLNNLPPEALLKLSVHCEQVDQEVEVQSSSIPCVSIPQNIPTEVLLQKLELEVQQVFNQLQSLSSQTMPQQVSFEQQLRQLKHQQDAECEKSNKIVAEHHAKEQLLLQQQHRKQMLPTVYQLSQIQQLQMRQKCQLIQIQKQQETKHLAVTSQVKQQYDGLMRSIRHKEQYFKQQMLVMAHQHEQLLRGTEVQKLSEKQQVWRQQLQDSKEAAPVVPENEIPESIISSDVTHEDSDTDSDEIILVSNLL